VIGAFFLGRGIGKNGIFVFRNWDIPFLGARLQPETGGQLRTSMENVLLANIAQDAHL
jgi:hypothetical protein